MRPAVATKRLTLTPLGYIGYRKKIRTELAPRTRCDFGSHSFAIPTRLRRLPTVQGRMLTAEQIPGLFERKSKAKNEPDPDLAALSGVRGAGAAAS